MPAAASELWPETPRIEVELTRYVGLDVPAPELPADSPRYADQLRANLLQALIDANPFEVSDAAIQETYDAIVAEIRVGLRAPLDLSDEQKADLRRRAEFAVKSGVLVQAVARREGIRATDADLEARFAELAAAYGHPVDAVKAQFAGHEDDLRRRIVEEKALTWLVERAAVAR
jgi:FKBP-type peptidyl-prolyl cis-trans isomerase (trigger factor)